MHVGIDLAWGERGRTGLAAVEAAGRLYASTSVRSDAEIDAWLDAVAPAPVTVGVDAPLVVRNHTGQRPAERALNRDYARFAAGAYPANRSLPWFDPPRAEDLVRRHGWTLDPDVVGRPTCLEVYPHAALVGLFGLPRRLPYKRGPQRHAAFVRLCDLLEDVPELSLGDSERWTELRALVERAGRGDLARAEDEVDAIVCAHVAWHWTYRRASLTTYGTVEDGFIVAPPPPEPAART